MILIAVKSCVEHFNRHDIVRTTWGEDAKALGITVRFFYGGETVLKHQSDEVQLACADGYDSLSYKTREICRWAKDRLFSHIFFCDTDTFLIPKLLLQSGFESADYAGKIDRPFNETFSYKAISRVGVVENHPRCWPWASGGYGYFLSRRAFEIVAEEKPFSYAEDLWVGQVLGLLIVAGKLTSLNTPPDQFSFHHSNHGEIYDIKKLEEWMQKMYKEYNAS